MPYTTTSPFFSSRASDYQNFWKRVFLSTLTGITTHQRPEHTDLEMVSFAAGVADASLGELRARVDGKRDGGSEEEKEDIVDAGWTEKIEQWTEKRQNRTRAHKQEGKEGKGRE